MTIKQQVEEAVEEGSIHSCYDFRNIPGMPDCCGSCHYDEEEGYGGLCSIKIKGREVECCCVVQNWLAKIME